MYWGTVECKLAALLQSALVGVEFELKTRYRLVVAAAWLESVSNLFSVQMPVDWFPWCIEQLEQLASYLGSAPYVHRLHSHPEFCPSLKAAHSLCLISTSPRLHADFPDRFSRLRN